MIELYEEHIENWYFNHRNEKTLSDYLCKDIILKNDDIKCLYERESVKQEL